MEGKGKPIENQQAIEHLKPNKNPTATQRKSNGNPTKLGNPTAERKAKEDQSQHEPHERRTNIERTSKIQRK